MSEKIFLLTSIAAILVFAKLWTIQANKIPKISEQERTLFKVFGYLICTGMITIHLYMLFNI